MTAGHEDDSYEQGLRDGRIKSLESAVMELATDVKKLKSAMWMLYGAIGLVTFAPEFLEFIRGGQ